MMTSRIPIPFNRPYMTGNELSYIAEASSSGKLAGDGPFTKRCQDWLQRETGTACCLLTHSCTAALEMAALLLDIRPGDEVIMPSYTFVSTANAFVLRGAVPVFVDIRADTLNIDEKLIEAAITERTRAIVPVHYAGVGCAMDRILTLAKQYDLAVVEDAAQGMMASYRGRPLGSIGDLGAFSFHETKNVISGEGGALLVNHESDTIRAEILREKGTNRSSFFRGQIDKYTWCDIGSSFLPSDTIAAFLWAQIEEVHVIMNRRLSLWQRYHDAIAPHEADGMVRRPYIPDECQHNAHMYYVLLPSLAARNDFIRLLGEYGISAVFHYQPLHSSPQGLRCSRTPGPMVHTDEVVDRLVRLPLWVGLEEHQDFVIDKIHDVINRISGG